MSEQQPGMREDRDIPNAGSESAGRILLIATGAVAAAMLLVCGGTAGYVGLVDLVTGHQDAVKSDDVAPPEMLFAPVSMTREPEAIQEQAAAVCGFDVPTDFKPFEAATSRVSKKFLFKRAPSDGALLKLGLIPKTSLANESPEERDRFLSQKIGMEMDWNETLISSLNVKDAPEREFKVLGQSAFFKFGRGQRVLDSKPICKVWGGFDTPRGVVLLVYTMPEQEYDESAFDRLIASIRPGTQLENDPDDDKIGPPLGKKPESD